MRQDKYRRISLATKERIVSVLSPALLLAVWQCLSSLGAIDRRFIPSPYDIFTAAIALTMSGELLDHLRASLTRLAAGLAIGSSIGVVVGILMGLSRWLRAAVDPIVASIYPIPKIAILPLVMIYLGLGEASKIFIVAFSVIFIVLINTMAGVLSIPSAYFDVAKNYRAPWFKKFWRVVLPGALPLIFVGLRLAIGVALILIVAAEFVAAQSGIGYLIWSSFEVMKVENMFVGIIIITVLGWLSTYGLKEIERRLMPWREV